jgi:hypothetical protein
MPFAPGGGKAKPLGRGGNVMPVGREPGGGKGRPLGRVGIWGTEPGRAVGGGIIPPGIWPAMPKGGGGMPPVEEERLVFASFGWRRGFGVIAHQLGNRKVEVGRVAPLGSGRAWDLRRIGLLRRRRR